VAEKPVLNMAAVHHFDLKKINVDYSQNLRQCTVYQMSLTSIDVSVRRMMILRYL